ncbi:hypothetical protein [Bacillus sp. CECT 9360]|uniref:hypothetical protein n=1 Tax=Bacillus sp. CECT 9360 TaxID=2845821 RepID=UPI001E61F5B1|nr:hypothetical protein [Bacillus sp. CECT 9360]CAH0347002.1 hypothetical protein BCI9360_03373 [Bacillus sp. CECT 9360]
MNAIFIILLSIAIVLLILSFFKKDHVKKLQEELEELTLTHMQDVYQLKKKIKILEEELLIQDSPGPSMRASHSINKPNEILKVQVVSLYQQGLSLEQITKQSTLPMETVQKIIEENGSRGAAQ